jgi:hypothetical protein
MTVTAGNRANPSHPDPGLCRDCQHSRRIESDRGSIFFRCELSLQDPRFPKYPRLPVLQCSGYQRIGPGGAA